ncbi:hypothetical protein AVEN_54745-1 [Araneus ventricosus]|uniref:Uncharacterized protein n=1 Tax=Araneus ventricosus TaxID=182803 RepID=A0A4Y2EC26_ARAVE|nr:hypothetical protein AVEN_54745-1 [Araneus ventricosus]
MLIDWDRLGVRKSLESLFSVLSGVRASKLLDADRLLSSSVLIDWNDFGVLSAEKARKPILNALIDWDRFGVRASLESLFGILLAVRADINFRDTSASRLGRPKTAGGNKDDFEDDDIGTDLLPD